ncbi:MAG: TonB-dependent receptor [Cryomorphaceae bacterium]|nr:TonB-dependent receptor [Cryomorphaceae bacterium]
MDENDEPLPFAQIAIFDKSNPDKPALDGTISGENGEFILTVNRVKNLELRVFFVGYENQNIDINLSKDKEAHSVGRIFMRPSSSELGAVDVEGKRAFMTSNLDKKVFDISQNIVSEGGTAEEALQNIPSVSVDMDGGISLRGSSDVTIWINGKPSALIGGDRNAFLDQLPASEIDRIEIITNPSSKYDADGTGGIINIILKKDRRNGTNGSFTTAVGTRNKTNQNLLLNHKQGKFNIGFSYSFNYREIYRERESSRTNFLSDSTFTNNQSSWTNNINRNHVARLSVDYEMNKRNTLGITMGAGHTNRHSYETDDFTFLDGRDQLFNEFSRRSANYRPRNTMEFGATHRMNFKQQGREWTSDFSFSRNTETDDQFVRQRQPAIYRPGFERDSVFRENFINENENTFLTIQTDYVHPLSEKSLFEIGAKTVMRTIDTDLERQIPGEDGEFMRDERVSNAFRFTETVHAAYGNYQNAWGKLRFQGGMRAEMAITQSEQRTTDSIYPYNYFNLFPSAFISYEVAKGKKWQASYTRRINRPSSRTLNPFTDVTDPLNFRRGNPTLIPEYFDSYEIGYERIIEKHTFTGALYFRSTNNQITRFRRLLDPSDPVADGREGITLTSFENLVSAQSMGFEGVYILSLGRKLNAQGSFNYFYRRLFGENIQADLNNEGRSWTTRGNANYSPTDKWSFQLSVFYWGPGPTPQGRRLGIFGTDIGAKYDFWNKKASVSLRISDIFNTRRFRLEIEDPAFVNTLMFNRETQIAFLSFTYKFGRDDKRTRDERKGRNGGGSDGEEMFDM